LCAALARARAARAPRARSHRPPTPQPPTPPRPQLISDCATCTKDGDSIFCSAAASPDNFVRNATASYSIRMKEALLGPSDGSKFCWAGTFGRLLQNSGGPYTMLGSSNVTVSLACGDKQLFYRQCVLDSQTATILICVGGIVVLLLTTCACFSCGCCRCCNNAGDDSKYGLCNRFCPWMPCSDPPFKEPEMDKALVNPLNEKDAGRSLFGARAGVHARAFASGRARAR
jgi:hypothetical protein